MTKVPKQQTWLDEVLPEYDEGRFRQVTRVSRVQFDQLLHLIDQHPTFHTRPHQIPVSVQLSIALYRFGVYGTGASIHKVARLFGKGDGETIPRVTRRFIKVI